MIKEIPQKTKDIFAYNPDTGDIFWKYHKRKSLINKNAGCRSSDGYIDIKIDDSIYKAHRIAWFLYYGDDPIYIIDHINGIKHDNKVSNLRLSTIRDNGMNRKTHRAGRLPGASFIINSKKWRSQITINNKKIYIGVFETELDAHLAYMEKRNETLSKGDYKNDI